MLLLMTETLRTNLLSSDGPGLAARRSCVRWVCDEDGVLFVDERPLDSIGGRAREGGTPCGTASTAG